MERTLGAGRTGDAEAGSKPVGVLDMAGLQQRLRSLDHGTHRSRGTTAVYLQHRQSVSRRGFHELLEETRRGVLGERQADTRRIHWLVPGVVWSVDPTELVLVSHGQRQKVPVLPVLDLSLPLQAAAAGRLSPHR